MLRMSSAEKFTLDETKGNLALPMNLESVSESLSNSWFPKVIASYLTRFIKARSAWPKYLLK
ncbi:hypothetical protein D3C76_1465710 [compost metagenome]